MFCRDVAGAARAKSLQTNSYNMVGIAQLVSAPDCGSGGPGFESLYPPFFIGLSPSGKAQDFDSCIRWFESN